MSNSRHVGIIGGGLAAVRVAEQLLRLQHTGPITIVSDEQHLPYDRPPLSKQVLRGEINDVSLKPAEFYRSHGVDIQLGRQAINLDTSTRTVVFADNSADCFDDIVIATGLIPRRIPTVADLTGLFVLRSINEAIALRECAATARSAVIIGAGFIGCEVAASLQQMGIHVTLIEPQKYPLFSVLGADIGARIAGLHRAAGVDVRCEVGVESLSGETAVEVVTLTDGTQLDTDLVVMGIGSRPATDWLVGSGIELDNGVICDDVGRSSTEGVWAIGDVASWRTPAGEQSRVEHWSNVAEQARALVHALLGTRANTPTLVPYFWSDQYDLKIQCLGDPNPTDTVHIVEEDGHKFLALFERAGDLRCVVGGGMPSKVLGLRSKVAAGVPIAEALR